MLRLLVVASIVTVGGCMTQAERTQLDMKAKYGNMGGMHIADISKRMNLAPSQVITGSDGTKRYTFVTNRINIVGQGAYGEVLSTTRECRVIVDTDAHGISTAGSFEGAC